MLYTCPVDGAEAGEWRIANVVAYRSPTLAIIWSSVSPPHPPTKKALIHFFLLRGSANFWNGNKTNMQLIAHGDYSSIASYRTKISPLFRGMFGIIGPKHVYQGLTHDGLLSSSSSSSPLCRVFKLIFLRKTMSLRNTVLHLFCCYYSWCLYR